jgi:hypothetical protein
MDLVRDGTSQPPIKRARNDDVGTRKLFSRIATMRKISLGLAVFGLNLPES